MHNTLYTVKLSQSCDVNFTYKILMIIVTSQKIYVLEKTFSITYIIYFSVIRVKDDYL